MGITANAEAYLDRANVRLAWILTLGFPSGTKRISEVDLGSASRGQHVGRIKSVSTIKNGFGEWRSGLEGQTVRVVISDLDGEFRSEIEGRSGASLYGSSAVLEWGSDELAPADWITHFTGIFDQPEQLRNGEVALVLRTDDRALQRKLNLPILTPGNVPFAVSPVLGGGLPIAYGITSARSLFNTTDGNTGAIPCLYIGEYGGLFTYIVSGGPMFSVHTAFSNGLATGGWARSNKNLGGLLCTVIGFAVSQGANAITVDGIGLHPGATSANPALAPYVTLISILRHVLNNFVFNAWRSQSTYFGDSPMIDATTWDAAEAYAIRQGWTNGLYLTASDVETRAVDLLQDAIRDKGIRFYWTPTGKLAIALRDHSPAAIYTSGARWIDAGQALDPGAIGKRSMQREDVDAVRRGIWRVAAGGDARSTVAIVRPGSSGSIVDTYAGRFGDPRRYMDRNMIAPSMAPFSSTLATPAFGLGQFAGGSGLKDGALVATWNGHSNGVNTRFDWSAAGADRPTLRLGRKNGRAALQFTTNKMDLSHDLSNVITADDHEIWMVFRVASITGADATPYNNHALLRDTNGVMGIFLSLAFGSLPVIQAHGFDGTHRFTSIIEVALNTWSVVRYRHKGGVASCFLWPNTFPSAANRFFETTATLGTITSLTGFPSIGKALSGTYFAGDIAEVLFFNASNLQGINGGQFNGGGYEWEILQTLCHEYGIPL